MGISVVIDVETTGLNPTRDRIIEIGVLQFQVSASGVPAIISSLGALQDPGEPLTPEIAQLTGLTDEVLRGKAIDWDAVARLLQGADMVIAHNAAFDRAFLMRHPEIKSLQPRFACSMQHIDWPSKGFASQRLTYLAADHGFLNPFPHRALFDCATTFKLIAPHLNELQERSAQRTYLMIAWDSPFDRKDLLKARSYRWDSDKRVWLKTTFEQGVEAERAFLKEQIYGDRADRHEEREVDFWQMGEDRLTQSGS